MIKKTSLINSIEQATFGYTAIAQNSQITKNNSKWTK